MRGKERALPATAAYEIRVGIVTLELRLPAIITEAVPPVGAQFSPQMPRSASPSPTIKRSLRVGLRLRLGLRLGSRLPAAERKCRCCSGRSRRSCRPHFAATLTRQQLRVLLALALAGVPLAVATVEMSLTRIAALPGSACPATMQRPWRTLEAATAATVWAAGSPGKAVTVPVRCLSLCG